MDNERGEQKHIRRTPERQKAGLNVRAAACIALALGIIGGGSVGYEVGVNRTSNQLKPIIEQYKEYVERVQIAPKGYADYAEQINDTLSKLPEEEKSVFTAGTLAVATRGAWVFSQATLIKGPECRYYIASILQPGRNPVGDSETFLLLPVVPGASGGDVNADRLLDPNTINPLGESGDGYYYSARTVNVGSPNRPESLTSSLVEITDETVLERLRKLEEKGVIEPLVVAQGNVTNLETGPASAAHEGLVVTPDGFYPVHIGGGVEGKEAFILTESGGGRAVSLVDDLGVGQPIMSSMPVLEIEDGKPTDRVLGLAVYATVDGRFDVAALVPLPEFPVPDFE